MPKSTIYRLYRLRRTILLVVAIVTLGALVSNLIGGIYSPFYFVADIAEAAGITLALACIAAILLPTCPVEHLAAAVVAAVMLATSHWHGLLFAPDSKGGAFDGTWQVIGFYAITGYFGWTVVLGLIALALERIMGLKAVFRGTIFRREPLDMIRPLFRVTPDTTQEHMSYDPVRWDGWAEVKTARKGHREGDFRIDRIEGGYLIRSVRSDPEVEVIEALITQTEGAAPDSVTTLRFSETSQGTKVQVHEVTTCLNAYRLLEFWLGDIAADHLHHEIDAKLGCPSRAIWRLPLRSVMLTISSLLTRRGPNSAGPSAAS
ncbi:hypothetical protein GTA62_14320 [Roseobacter sp. HKCCD9010]|uniref:hypothetical protein n=1 Tax=unclassified Roseobacter TaxID=196798 RepID=UPI001492D7B1|nr:MULTISPECIES: hypothetical protein [unclassified Roseobacter]MBF9050713.1 hypothetical protein [Rhodobacterales bacterium HKCCD4356]NNV11869.1 hypothetical protein [Roseobacter sp. HKCCD7357]NNV18020.1 hypothetical protein [Roseobacter sp. HKCCD8768]NNV26111.1 hypothetical protein [Roseobacter sp. HKCCD8192]NNV31747.1 hypothetical protein [Roseobacter sp. HKCCD9061]